jgi:hypothetical protein
VLFLTEPVVLTFILCVALNRSFALVVGQDMLVGTAVQLCQLDRGGVEQPAIFSDGLTCLFKLLHKECFHSPLLMASMLLCRLQACLPALAAMLYDIQTAGAEGLVMLLESTLPVVLQAAVPQ